jgi:hypothetical protein
MHSSEQFFRFTMLKEKVDQNVNAYLITIGHLLSVRKNIGFQHYNAFLLHQKSPLSTILRG